MSKFNTSQLNAEDFKNPEFVQGLLDSQRENVDYKKISLVEFVRLQLTHQGRGCTGSTLLKRTKGSLTSSCLNDLLNETSYEAQ